MHPLYVPSFRSVLPITLLAAFASAQISVLPAAPLTPLLVERDFMSWQQHGGNVEHTGVWQFGTQPLRRIRWQTPVDLQPQYTGSLLLIHYGTPLCTNGGTVVLPVKTGATGAFQLEGRRVATGALVWTMPTDYVLPPHNWVPTCGAALSPLDRVAVPAAGGTVLLRTNPNGAIGTVTRVAFYGLGNYQANQAAYDANVVINTPITVDSGGNMFFGFGVMGSTPVPLQSGIARIGWNGAGTWVAAATACNDPAIQRVVHNCAPAMSLDDRSLYIACTESFGSGFGSGYLVKLDATTLQMQARVRLMDNANPTVDAYLADDGSACPTVGPDGDVFFGVLERPFPANNARGWMRHYDASLSVAKPVGAFGWDDTCSIVPRAAVPSYSGPSSYLIMTKYNNYGGIGTGDGQNKLAVLDPNVTMVDPISGTTVMNEVLTVLSPTADWNYPGGVREWCINTAAIDVAGKSALVNCEDGKAYRWNFVTNTLSEAVTLTAGIGEAYTSTMIGSDGTVFAIANATLYALGR